MMPCVLLIPAALATRLMFQPFTRSLTLSNAGDCLGDRKLQHRGSTICLRGRACCITSSYECPQLSQDARG
ncbi:hypothetical protein BC827DRAFT_1168369 [Russula dissimulans]|nr:hypothetical protein BC827DRAFT_1168369 [Russula dissimulans]